MEKQKHVAAEDLLAASDKVDNEQVANFLRCIAIAVQGQDPLGKYSDSLVFDGWLVVKAVVFNEHPYFSSMHGLGRNGGLAGVHRRLKESGVDPETGTWKVVGDTQAEKRKE